MNEISIFNIKLLYRASKDGLISDSLSDKINNKSNLVFLFLTGNTRVFGIFFKSKILFKLNSYIADENAFVFSLNNYKIYKILTPEKAIGFFKEDLIRVGNTGDSNGFWIYLKKINDEGLLKNPKIYDFQKNKELTEGLKELSELEIFEINFK